MSLLNPNVITFDQLLIAARTVYGEARSEPEGGVLAVACVIWNRARKRHASGRSYWWGGTIDRVCMRKWQFSVWNPETAGQPEDRNYRAMKRATTRQLRPFFDAVLLAQHVAGTEADPTKGACHYHADYVSPRWARGKRPSATIGRHLFYAGIR